MASPVIVELRGRLGNQLFCWATGTAIAKRRDLDVLFSTRFADSALDISDFCIPLPRKESSRLVQAYQRSKVLKGFREATGFKSVVQESGHVFDERILAVRGGQTIRGHFQSPQYFEAYRDEFSEILSSVKVPSQRFKELATELADVDWLAVQVRGGDYFQHFDKFVVVGDEYYKFAVDQAKCVGLHRVVVFTDDLAHAQRLFPNCDTFVVGNVDLSPAESLLLAKSATALVGTNSTFSWWSAYLMSPDRMKIFPSRWYQPGFLGEETLFPDDFALYDQ